MELILIRHGQTIANLLDALDTAYPGAPLNARGHHQAEGIVETWRELSLGVPDVIVASPLTRTRQSARPLAAHFGLPVRTDSRLREVRAGDLEMLSRLDAPAAYLAVIASWVHGEIDRRMPGGEAGGQVIGRVDSLVRDLAATYGEEARVVLVSHGGLTRLYSAARLEGITPELVMSQPVRNCALTVATGSPTTGWRARIYSSQPVDSWEVIPGLRRFRRSVQVIGHDAR